MPLFHPLPLLVGFLLASAVSGAAWAARALTVSGALSAALLGAVIFGLGGWSWAAALLLFFLTSSALSRWRKQSKDELGFEKTGRRDAAQVWANGGVATVCVVLPFVFSSVTVSESRLLFLAALAAANADTWATEIGAVRGGTPFLITTGGRVKRGTSGGVTAAGLFAALLGAALLGAFTGGWNTFTVVTVAGWSGALLDSVLGATIQAQWREADGRLTERSQNAAPARGFRLIGNDIVNTLCTLLAVVLASILRR